MRGGKGGSLGMGGAGAVEEDVGVEVDVDVDVWWEGGAWGSGRRGMGPGS